MSGWTKLLFTFEKISDANEIFLIEFKELPNVRLSGGGVKVLSNGTWQNIEPYNLAPDPPDNTTSYSVIPYLNGIILFNNFDTANLNFIQIDIRKFLLIRQVKGTGTVPLIDGYEYETNGSISNSKITLSANQYALFWRGKKPTLGTYLTSDLESTNGCKIEVIDSDGTTKITEFWLQYGHGSFKLDYSRFTGGGVGGYVATAVYSDNHCPPAIIIYLAWRERKGYLQTWILIQDEQIRPAYINDPNTTTNRRLDRVCKRIIIFENYEDAGFYGHGIEWDAHDTNRDLRFSQLDLIAYKYDETNDRWIVRKKCKLICHTDIHNYDESGATIGFGILASGDGRNMDENRRIDDNYKAYKVFPSALAGWKDYTWNKDDYTWVEDHSAVRLIMYHFGKTLYVYTHYLEKGGTLVGSTYKYGRWHDTLHYFCWLYYDDWADKTLDAGTIIAYSLQTYYSSSDFYEDPPPTETDYGSDTTFIDKYFPILIETTDTSTYSETITTTVEEAITEVLVSESGSGLDAILSFKTLPISETSTSTDLILALKQLSIPETASSLETLLMNKQLITSDSVLGTDEILKSLQFYVQDSSSSLESIKLPSTTLLVLESSVG
ncbi:MAG: hypothetical protein DRP01_09960, partial [Archaeoglobales archaeon]